MGGPGSRAPRPGARRVHQGAPRRPQRHHPPATRGRAGQGGGHVDDL